MIVELVDAPVRMDSIYPVSVLHAGSTAEYVREGFIVHKCTVTTE
jgi:hypothetical protein